MSERKKKGGSRGSRILAFLEQHPENVESTLSQLTQSSIEYSRTGLEHLSHAISGLGKVHRLSEQATLLSKALARYNESRQEAKSQIREGYPRDQARISVADMRDRGKHLERLSSIALNEVNNLIDVYNKSGPESRAKSGYSEADIKALESAKTELETYFRSMQLVSELSKLKKEVKSRYGGQA